MDALSLLVGFLAGILIGALALLFLAGKYRNANDQTRQSVLLLTERVQSRDSELQKLQAAVLFREEELNQARLETARYVADLAAASERNLRLHDLQTMLEQKDAQVLQSKDQITALERNLGELNTLLQEERKASTEKLVLLGETKQKFEEVFKALSDSALNRNTESFMHIARNIFDKYQEGARIDLEHRQKSIDQLVKPLAESLQNVDLKMNAMEQMRATAYELLTDQVGRLAETQNKLQQALRAPATRGRWGEVQLRRVVEMAGMVQHCDFVEQETVDGPERKLRPDMVILLPEGKTVVVDSKVPLQAYLDALDAPDDIAKRKLIEEHVRQLRAHIIKLSQKSYWEQFSQTPEFVVLFLPNDAFFIAAAEQDHSIIEDSIKNKVLIATPMTLVALLQTVAYAWRQQSVAENAAEIKELGKQLYDRVRTLAGYFEDMRRGLDSTVKSYNKAVGTLERRVLVTTRKFKELGAAEGAEIEIVEPSESIPAELHLRELITAARADDDLLVSGNPVSEIAVT